MPIDYAPKAEKARIMIAKYGRDVVFTQLRDDVNAADPLAGPVSAPIVSAAVPAVCVYPTGETNLGYTVNKTGMFKESEKIFIIGNHNIDYKLQAFMTDADGTTWKVDAVQEFAPGNLAILYYVGVISP